MACSLPPFKGEMNMIILTIAGDRTSFFQWDLYQKLNVTGDCEEVHFANIGSSAAIVKTVSDGEVDVPNSLLQEPYPIKAYAYDTDHTICQFSFIVLPRPCPNDYVSPADEDQERWSGLDERISALEEGGADGEDGATFTPSIDENGNLSWTNDKELENPPEINIKGPKGDTGAEGPTGAIGPAGAKGAKGDKGDKGDTGNAGANGSAGTDGITPHIGANGNWFIGDTDTTIFAGQGTNYIVVTDPNVGTENAGIMSYTLQPNVMYIFPTLIELSITLASGTTGRINEYMFQVTADSTDGLTFLHSGDIVFTQDVTGAAGKTYEVNVLNNKGLSYEW